MTRSLNPNGSAGGQLPGYPQAQDPDAGMDALRLVRILRRHWLLIVITTALVSGIAWVLVPEDTTVYRATASLVLNDSRGRLPASVMGGTGMVVQSPEYMSSQVQVLLSRSVLGDAVDREGLQLSTSAALPARLLSGIAVAPDQRPLSMQLQFASDSFVVRWTGGGEREQRLAAAYGDTVHVEGVRFAISEPPAAAEASMEVMPRDAAIATIRQRIGAAPRQAAAIIDVTFLAADPERAARVLNAVALAYRDHNVRSVREGARVYRNFIEEQLAQSELRLTDAQQALANFRNASPYYNSQERVRVEQAELLSLDTQREQLQADQRAFVAFLRRVERGADEQIDRELTTLMAGTGANPSQLLSQLYTELAQHQGERERLLAGGIAPTNPQVLQLNTLIAAARREVVDAAQTQVRALEGRIAALQTQREQTLETLQTLPAPEAEEIRLAQEVSLAQGTAQSLRAEYQRALLLESLDLGQVEILDAAAGAAPEPSGNRARNLVFASLLGVMLGMVGAVAREQGDRSIRRRGEAEAELAAPGLGVIPPIARQVHMQGWRPSFLQTRHAARQSTNGGGDPKGYDLAADAYRKLRTNLAFLRSDEELRTLVVTSSASDEGKTTTAANLAVAFARQGRVVLLVDCDLRRPRLHTLFGTDGNRGIIDVLLGGAEIEECIVPTGEDHLFLLPRGAYDERAVEILSGAAMEKLLARVRAEFDLVIFDTSPLLLTADTASMAALVDGVLLVVRAGRTARAALGQASHDLDVVGAQLLGFVLNDPDAVAARLGDYYPYQYEEAQT